MLKKLGLGSLLFATIIGAVALAQTVLNPQNSALVCAYNASPPTLTTGTFGYVQCNSSGQLSTTPLHAACFTNLAVTGCTSGASQTFTVPGNVSTILVDGCGAGGPGGGGGTGSSNAGGASGASAMCLAGYPYQVTPGSAITLTIPAVTAGGLANSATAGSTPAATVISGGISPDLTINSGAGGAGTTGVTGGAGATGAGPGGGAAGLAGAIWLNAQGGAGGGAGGNTATTGAGGRSQGAYFAGNAGSGNAAGAGGPSTMFGRGGTGGGGTTPSVGLAPTIGYGGGGGGGGPGFDGGPGGPSFVRFHY